MLNILKGDAVRVGVAVQEVLGSDLGKDTKVSRVFCQTLQACSGTVSRVRPPPPAIKMLCS
jgi:hypothetical protein